MNGSEAAGDLVLIQTSLLSYANAGYLASQQHNLYDKISEVCINRRSPAASLLSCG